MPETKGKETPRRRGCALLVALPAVLAALVLSTASCGKSQEESAAAKAPEFFWGWWQLIQVGNYLQIGGAPADYRTPTYILVTEEAAIPIKWVSEFTAREPGAGAPSWAFTEAGDSSLATAVLSLRRRAGNRDSIDLAVGSRSITAIRAASPRTEGGFVGTAASLLGAARAAPRALMQPGVSLAIQNALNPADRVALSTGEGGLIIAPSSITGDPYLLSFPGLPGMGTVVLRPAYAGGSAGYATATAAGSPNYKLYRPSYAATFYHGLDPVEVDELYIENVGAAASGTATYALTAGADARLYDASNEPRESLTGPLDLAGGGRERLAVHLQPLNMPADADEGFAYRSLRLRVSASESTIWEDEIPIQVNLRSVLIHVNYDAASSGGGTNYPMYAIIRPDNRVSQALAANIPGDGPMLAPDPREVPDRPEPCLVLVRNEYRATLCAVGTAMTYAVSGAVIPVGAQALAGNGAATPTEVPFGSSVAFTIPQGAEYWFRVWTRQP